MLPTHRGSRMLTRGNVGMRRLGANQAARSHSRGQPGKRTASRWVAARTEAGGTLNLLAAPLRASNGIDAVRSPPRAVTGNTNATLYPPPVADISASEPAATRYAPVRQVPFWSHRQSTADFSQQTCPSRRRPLPWSLASGSTPGGSAHRGTTSPPCIARLAFHEPLDLHSAVLGPRL